MYNNITFFMLFFGYRNQSITQSLCQAGVSLQDTTAARLFHQSTPPVSHLTVVTWSPRVTWPAPPVPWLAVRRRSPVASEVVGRTLWHRPSRVPLASTSDNTRRASADTTLNHTSLNDDENFDLLLWPSSHVKCSQWQVFLNELTVCELGFGSRFEVIVLL